MDRLTKERRSWNTSRIRSRDTLPDRTVRSILHNLGFRFRLHGRDLPGSPDIVLPRHRTVIFVHGCYWHRHSRCKFAYFPKSRVAFWTQKFADNIRRDTHAARKLRRLGWRVLTVWECQTAIVERLRERLARLLTNPGRGDVP